MIHVQSVKKNQWTNLIATICTCSTKLWLCTVDFGFGPEKVATFRKGSKQKLEIFNLIWRWSGS